MTQHPIVLAFTGASGAIYGLRLLDVLLAAGREVHLSLSPSGALVLKQELGLETDVDHFDPHSLALAPEDFKQRSAMPEAMAEVLRGASHDPSQRRGDLVYHHYRNLMAPIASGSFLTDGMVVCPCSLSSLGAIVHGTGDNLIHRAAGVHLKERRKLIVVPRETPLSMIQLDNMRRAAEAGATVLPAMPGFYHGVRSIADLVDFIVARICDQLGVANELMHRWGSKS